MWTVRWRSANITYGDQGSFGGTMKEVDGTIHSGGSAASEFRAENAEVEEESRVLRLSGGVEVKSESGTRRLTCERIEWDPDREVIEAKGNVRFETKDFVVGPFAALRISPELRIAGTPDLFEKRYGSKPDAGKR